jgi:transcriptional regulator with XRE-family HTH domain
VARNLYTDEHEELVTLLKDLRLEKGMSQSEVAEQLDRPQTFLSSIEVGDRVVSVVQVLNLCRVYGLTFVEFAERLEKRIETKESKRRPPRRTRAS